MRTTTTTQNVVKNAAVKRVAVNDVVVRAMREQGIPGLCFIMRARLAAMRDVLAHAFWGYQQLVHQPLGQQALLHRSLARRVAWAWAAAPRPTRPSATTRTASTRCGGHRQSSSWHRSSWSSLRHR